MILIKQNQDITSLLKSDGNLSVRLIEAAYKVIDKVSVIVGLVKFEGLFFRRYRKSNRIYISGCTESLNLSRQRIFSLLKRMERKSWVKQKKAFHRAIRGFHKHP
ncbi:hypothetical protein [Aeromonas enteropelogenes]|uniref:hypothetical protein n=1 Tax=Aeromonas enteropelogenes TaxID=29489 RepID=UPI003BA1F022